MFIKDILNELNKDQLKEIRDYLYKNGVYIQKKAKKSITDSLLKAIYKPTPLKWPANNPINNPTNNPTDDSTNNPTDDPADNPTNGPTNNSTLALLLLSTAPV